MSSIMTTTTTTTVKTNGNRRLMNHKQNQLILDHIERDAVDNSSNSNFNDENEENTNIIADPFIHHHNGDGDGGNDFCIFKILQCCE